MGVRDVQVRAEIGIEGLYPGEGERIAHQCKIRLREALRHESQHGRRLGQDAAIGRQPPATRALGLTFRYSGERCCAEPKSMRTVE